MFVFDGMHVPRAVCRLSVPVVSLYIIIIIILMICELLVVLSTYPFCHNIINASTLQRLDGVSSADAVMLGWGVWGRRR